MTYGINPPEQQQNYGANPPPQKQKKPVHKRWWFWVLIVIGFFVILPTKTGGSSTPAPTVTVTETVTAAPEPDPEPETEPVADDEAPNTESEPTPEEPPFEITHKNDLTKVHFEIENALFKSGIKRNAERQTIEALRAAVEEYPNYHSINVIGEFLTTDQYGNEDMSSLLDLYFEKETVEKINFDNTHNIKIFEIHNGGKLHPDLRG